MLSYIHVFRGIAALLVVLHHSAGISEKYFNEISVEQAFLFGNAGVDFFFVLSGFIIYYVHKDWIGKPGKVGDYLWRRFIRVYPLYWIVFMITLPLYYALYKRLPDAIEIFKSFFLIEHEMIVYVAWTLVHETTFYIMFSMLIISQRIGLVILGGWLLLILVKSPSNIFFDTWFDIYANHITSNYNLLFFLGMLAAYCFSKSRMFVVPLYCGLLGIVFFLSCRLVEVLFGMDGKMDIFYAISSFLIIYGFSTWETGVNKIQAPANLLLILGSASYSIYLVHSQVISGITKAFVILELTNSLDVTVAFAFTAFISTVGGILFYMVIEKPMLCYFKRRDS